MYYIKAMETYCIRPTINTKNKNSSIRKTKQNRLMLSSNYAVCGKKKSTFIKNQELSNDHFQMNKIINKFLLTRNKFMLDFAFETARIYLQCLQTIY